VTIASGTLSPGTATDPLAALTVGDLVMSTGGGGGQMTTLMTVSGSNLGQYDRIVADGAGNSITYAGTLDLTMTGTAAGGAYAYADMTTFRLFSGFSRSGTSNFSSIVLHAAGTKYDNLAFAFQEGAWKTGWTNQTVGQRLVFDAVTGAIIVVPEPGTLALAGIAVACFVGAARWRRRAAAAAGRREPVRVVPVPSITLPGRPAV
jgi:hypothetical protein